MVTVALVAACDQAAADEQQYRHGGVNMEPGIQAGQVVAAQAVDPERYEPARGDIVVFRMPATWNGSADEEKISRIIAVGGETVACCDEHGRVTVNGTGLDEPYLGDVGPLSDPPGGCGGRRFEPVAVPADHVFVMGDNRLFSVDSVCMGPVPSSAIIATVPE